MIPTQELENILELAEKATSGSWKSQRNPMRDDGSFVRKDGPLEPYPGNIRNMDGVLYMRHPPAIFPFQLPHADADYIASVSPDRITEIVKELIELRKFVAISRDTAGSWLSASLSCGAGKEMERDVRAWFDAFPKGYF